MSIIYGLLNFCILALKEYGLFGTIRLCKRYEFIKHLLFCSTTQFIIYRKSSEFIFADDSEETIIDEYNKVNVITDLGMANYGIVFKSLSNSYLKRDKLISLSLRIEKSACYAVVSPNSVVRSSIFKMFTKEELIDNGDIFVNGKSIKTDCNALQNVGYCSNDPVLFKHMTVRENLKILFLIKGYTTKCLKKEIQKLCEDFGLTEFLNEVVNDLEIPYRKLLGLTIALVGNPQTIVFEEPTIGMDSVSTKKFASIISKLKLEGKSILFLTSYIQPYETICDKFAIIAEGEMKFLSTPQAFKDKYSNGISLVVEMKPYDSENERSSMVDKIKSYIQETFIESRLRYESLF